MHHTKIRQHIKTRYAQLDSQWRKQANAVITERLCDHPLLKYPHRIGAYLPFGHEIDIRPWFEQAWAQGHTCYLPITLEKHLAFGSYTANTVLKPNRWGILEPHLAHSLCSPTELEIVLVPLMAFDEAGYRLGRGKGYYDRTFSFLLQKPRVTQPYLIGLAYSFQHVDRLMPAPWDVPLNEVITEKQHYCFHSAYDLDQH